MKKGIVLLLIASMIVPVFAASTANGINSSASQDVTLTIGEDLYSYNVGFSTDGNKANSDISATGLLPKDGNRTIADNSGSDLYVWWDILTADNFTVTLSLDAALTEQNSDGEPETIDYKVDGIVSAGVVKPETADEPTPVALDSTGTKSINIIDFDGGTSVANSFKGNQKLTIATKEGELQGKPEGEYKSTLTLTVTNEQ